MLGAFLFDQIVELTNILVFVYYGIIPYTLLHAQTNQQRLEKVVKQFFDYLQLCKLEVAIQ